MSKHDGGPVGVVGSKDHVTVNGTIYKGWPGMTLRDYFAGQTLDALTRSVLAYGDEPDGFEDTIARYAYAIADAMLRARAA